MEECRMLMKVLKRLAQGDRYSNKIMARELGIDEGMVEQMLMQLERKGYIVREEMASYAGSCRSEEHTSELQSQ